MSDEVHVQLVRSALEKCASARAELVNSTGIGTTAAWRDQLLFSAYKGDWNAFDRTYLARFSLHWFKELEVRSPHARITAGTRLDLSGADLRGGLFARRIFTGGSSPFEGSNLRGAKLDDSEWLGMDLVAADLSDASLKQAFLLKVMCQGASFHGANLAGAQLALIETDGVFRHGSLAKAGTPADFSSANLSGARIVLGFPLQVRLENANLQGCTISYIPPKDKDQRDRFNKRLDEFVAQLSDDQRSDMILERPEIAKGRCFLATAACGPEESGELATLQEFRETVLKPTPIGARFVTAYESLSPPLARLIEGSTFARGFVRRTLVVPAARFAAWMLRNRRRRG
jgi:uncharacterized protein YjbI with pentapeptide repeats